MSTTVSSKRYAQAIYLIAQKNNSFDEWQLNLRRIAKLMQDREFADIVDNPKVPFELKTKLAEALLGKTNQETMNLVYLLITKNKFRNIGEISEEYESLLNEHYGIKRATVTTAVELDDAARNKLSHQLEALIGSKAKVEFSVAPSIIGGFVARVNGSLIDGSIQNKLNLLRKNIS